MNESLSDEEMAALVRITVNEDWGDDCERLVRELVDRTVRRAIGRGFKRGFEAGALAGREAAAAKVATWIGDGSTMVVELRGLEVKP